MPAPDFEKTPFASKKFLAYFVTTMSLMVTHLVCLFTIATDLGIFAWSLMLGIVLVQGFICSYALGGIAATDRYTRVAQIVAGMGRRPPLTAEHAKAFGHAVGLDGDEKDEDDSQRAAKTPGQ